MPVANPTKTVNVSSMHCGDTATVTMSFQSAAGLAFHPADIVLIMDRSCSMTEEKMKFAKAAAKHFIDMVEETRNGGTRMGLVSFGDTAKEEVSITDSFSTLKPAIDALTRSGNTNHKAAFGVAKKMLNVPSSVRQLVVMFTDGESTVGGDPSPVIQELKDKNVEIFCIGLSTDPAPLNLWATAPVSTHVAYTDDPAQLDRVFHEIGAEVILAGVRDAVLQEQLMPDFKIVKVHTPAVGTVQVTGPQTLTWTLDVAGTTEQPSTISLSFDIMHIGTNSGELPVNHSVLYTDRDGNTLKFPSPTVNVDCSGDVICQEKCPNPSAFTILGCEDAAQVTLDDVTMQGLGRIVQVDVTLKSICPGKRVAVSIFLMEKAEDGTESPRGVKHILVPAHTGDSCQDVILKCVKFSLPEALDASGRTGAICNPREFTTRVIANYVDFDFACCDAETVIL